MFNPAKAADQIKKEYIGYISTTFRFRDQDLQKHLLDELDKTVSKGPFIEIKDTFLTGQSIEQMILSGVLSPIFRNLEKSKEHYNRKLPLDRPLYLHQEKAIKKIISGKNVVVSTGTGSGKTNCFIIPVINQLLIEQEKGKLNNGVRAIFVYPMNALANDQIKSLREILMYYPEITFGVYNGGTEHNETDAIKLYEVMYANDKYPELRKRLPNELLSREEMKQTPPHILFTNYAMLEYMLFRPGDDTIFSNSNFNFIVLDEAHVYTGAKGIETSLLMSRLKGRLNGERKPQFILTSATLGDGSVESNEKVLSFAKNLTGGDFFLDDIITAERNINYDYPASISYKQEFYIDLANDELIIRDTLSKYNVTYNSNSQDFEIIYDLVIQTDLYAKMRGLGSLITFEAFVKELNISREAAVSFVSLCAKAQKDGKSLVDIRYHYFLRALDGGYLSLDYPESLSLTRKDTYYSQKMFEIAVCDDCGEIALIGKQANGKLTRAIIGDERELYQVIDEDNEDFFTDNDNAELDMPNLQKIKKIKTTETYVLCKSCGSIVADDESHNKWCTCDNKNTVRLVKLLNDRCVHCNYGSLRNFNLGYEEATGVISTSLYEQLPEYTFVIESGTEKEQRSKGIFDFIKENKKHKEYTTRQFLVFSDSRQGAAKFACHLEDSYKEFLRRRGIWNVSEKESARYPNGLSVSDFTSLLENYFSSLRLFRKNYSDHSESSRVENRRNAWVAVLNELVNSSRDTSLVSLGKIQFEYLGNTDKIIDAVTNNYKVNKRDVKNFLNYLAYEIVRIGAIAPDELTDINDTDREYIFYSRIPKTVTKNKDRALKTSTPFLPTAFQKKNGEKDYYRSNKLTLTKNFLKLDNNKAIDFLEQYWDYLVSRDNEYCLQSRDGKGFYFQAKCFKIFLGNSAKLWQCDICKTVSPFNISNECIRPNCNGHLTPFNTEQFCKEDYYAMRYESKKLSPLFVKEHTAQLAKKDALDYQQLFLRKEINALSCSTTFEMGVDLGDLETVFLRNIPPLASNYSQRTGRAGRSIYAAAFALTYARLSSHDFTFFDNPEAMINGVVSPPQFKLENEKIIKRHIYAVALSLYFKSHPDLYNGNDAKSFINEKHYEGFLEWINRKPIELKVLLQNSIPNSLWSIKNIEIDTFGWVEDFSGSRGRFSLLVQEFESNIAYLKKEHDNACNSGNINVAQMFQRKLDLYQKNNLIDFLVRGNILPKYDFPIDVVELSQNINSKSFKSLNLNRDLSIAIADYAPSAEIVADGGLYTSRYIRKPIVNKSESNIFETSYIANCPNCRNMNYSKMPISVSGIPCGICGNMLFSMDFYKSIEPRAGFISEKDVKQVPLTSQERKYKTEAIYIGDKNAYPYASKDYKFNTINIKVESTVNDSLVVKSTDFFYVCPLCGYSIATNEAKLKKYTDYVFGVKSIQNGEKHENPFGRGECENTRLDRYWLHHEFKTDVAKITFYTDTSDTATMLSVLYALLKSFANTQNIEHRDLKACLTYKKDSNRLEHKIIIYDDVPGGAGHSRRLITEDGLVLKRIIENAIQVLEKCECEPSCYKCLRSYENQKIHEILDRQKAFSFLKRLV